MNDPNEMFQPFFELTRSVPKMIVQHNFRVFLVNLVLCFCAGSLMVLQFKQVNSFSLEIFETEAQDFEPLNETECEDDFLVFLNGTAIANILLATSASMKRGFQSYFLSPIPQPPKHR